MLLFFGRQHLIWKIQNLVLLQGLNQFLAGSQQVVAGPCVLLVVKLHVFPVHLARIFHLFKLEISPRGRAASSPSPSPCTPCPRCCAPAQSGHWQMKCEVNPASSSKLWRLRLSRSESRVSSLMMNCTWLVVIPFFV